MAMQIGERQLETGIAFLAEAGLNLFAVLDCALLPESIAAPLRDSGVPLADQRRLVLLGHGGRPLWAALQKWGLKTADPVDQYTLAITRQFLRDYLDDPPVSWLYPQGIYCNRP